MRSHIVIYDRLKLKYMKMFERRMYLRFYAQRVVGVNEEEFKNL